MTDLAEQIVGYLNELGLVAEAPVMPEALAGASKLAFFWTQMNYLSMHANNDPSVRLDWCHSVYATVDVVGASLTNNDHTVITTRTDGLPTAATSVLVVERYSLIVGSRSASKAGICGSVT